MHKTSEGAAVNDPQIDRSRIPRTAVRGWFKFFLLPTHFSLRRASRGMDLIAFHLESVPDKLPDWDYGYVMNGEVPRQKFEF